MPAEKEHRCWWNHVSSELDALCWACFWGSLVYEAISSDTVTIQDLTPAKRDDIQMFRNDIEINITTVGQLQCSQIVESKLSLSGDNGYMVNASAEDFQKPVCVDTMKGPLVRVSCKSCIITSDKYLFTWEFQDQLNANLTASAVGFEIHASATAFLPHKSSLIAIIPAGSNVPSPLAATLRGSDWNVIGLNFVPRIFKSKGDLKLIQIMFHMFTSGSYVVTMKEMQDALAKQQGVRVALQVNVLSQYLVATTYRSYFGIVKFLAYLGGLYVLCRFLFLIILLQCESIFSKLLYEEKLLNKVVAKERARAHWAKVRIFVKHAKLSNAGKYQVPKKQYPLCDSVKSGHSPTEGTSGAGNYVDKKVIQSRFLVRQYRKPPWIHEQEALPPVPEPPYFVDHPNYEGERVAFLENAHEYLQSMYNYSARLRRDYLTTVAVLDKVGWYFGLHKN